MRRVLFICECATVAHPARSSALASSLLGKSYEVLFAVDRHYDAVIGEYPGQRLLLHSRSPVELNRTLKRGGALFDTDLLAHYVDEELSLIKAYKPDLVVGDMRPSLSVSTRLTGVPLATVTNAHWSVFANRQRFPLPPLPALKLLRHFGKYRSPICNFLEEKFQSALPKVLAFQGAGINELRMRHGLSEFADYFDGFTHGDIIFFADTPLLAPLRCKSPHQHYLGHVPWAPLGTLPSAWWDAAQNRKRAAYVTLGSSGDVSNLRVIVDELLDEQFDVLVATAARASSLPEHGRLHIVPFAPGDAAAALANLVVTNGGSPSSYQALACGKPVIGICTNMDQLLTATQLTRLGVGILMRGDMLARGDIRLACEKLSNNETSAKLRLVQSELAAFRFDEIFHSRIENFFSEGNNERKFAL